MDEMVLLFILCRSFGFVWNTAIAVAWRYQNNCWRVIDKYMKKETILYNFNNGQPQKNKL